MGVHHICIRAVSTRVSEGMMEHVPWMPGAADLVLEGVSQGVLAAGLEPNEEVDCGARRRTAQALPIIRDGVSGVLGVACHPNMVRGASQGAKETNGNLKDGEPKDPTVSHGYGGSARWCIRYNNSMSS